MNAIMNPYRSTILQTLDQAYKLKGRRIIMNTFNKKIVVTFSFLGKGVVRAKAHTELEACFPVADAIQRGRRRARVALKRELEKEREWINSPQRVWNW